ncbi:acetoin dehydrogenase dihydrolipoyllysine-residue acetyltransferase subunit [Paraburkholderia sp. BCC1885]|uniref:acetoin dehydrogenase dihydrolipoyllysine-residue acetyltransferase subunit n=1 Tax=Paraburkholderia sp. BCC1885 TaxID=2562669 RepID=UPI001184003F|nr:acetoin dehydrogenase dihydrolipoyllysine-residue acetyltransferase subunit [Paraburkholderia sp. BCC1885]
MPTEVILPRVDMDMSEGMIAAWHVNEGDEVREGTLIFEIETSKATMEIDAPASGIIRQISAAVGKTVPVGTAVAWIYAQGEALCERGGDAQADEPQSLRATPAARRLARERGLRLVDIPGSGPYGRVAAQDVLLALAQADVSGQAAYASSPSTRLLHTVTLRKGSGGDPLVLLHGFAAELNSWRPFSQAMARLDGPEPGIVAVDLPAHGKSSAQAAGSLEEMIEALENTLLDAGITRCHLLGHSFGGALALAATARTSQLEVASLTLLAPAGLGPEINGAFLRGLTEATRRTSLAAWLKQLFADPARMDEGFVATAAQQLESPEVRERLASVADNFFPDGTQMLDLRHLFDDLTMPVRVLWGQQDRILPVRHADGLPGHVAVHRFAGVGHLPYLEAEAQVARIVAQNMMSATAPSAPAPVTLR